ncbi:MAG: hypothetical protein ACO3JL_13955 [Myxococcota bacterium]
MPISAATWFRPGMPVPARTPASPSGREVLVGGGAPSSPSPAGGPDRFEPTTDRRLAERDAFPVPTIQARSTAPAGGLELFIQTPDDQTVVGVVSLRYRAKNWWVPGAYLPDVLQRDGWFLRSFVYNPVPEQVGPNLYRVAVKPGWYARLCGAELQPDNFASEIQLRRTSNQGEREAYIGLVPDLSHSSASSTATIPAQTPDDMSIPQGTAAIAGARGASSTINIEWPR